MKKPPNQISSSDLKGVFGAHWDDPNEWLLLSINASQEIYNPFDDTRALIGGNVKEIAVGLAPLN